MYKFVIFFVLCSGLTAHGASLPQIVGGDNAPIGKYPYQVSLRLKGEHHCGGSIIDKRYILSAAHCFLGPDMDSGLWKVHVGTNFLNESGIVYDVEKIIPHEEFNTFFGEYDIALLRLTKDIEFTDKVKPVPLATTNIGKVGDVAVATGWGSVSMLMDEMYNILQEVALKIVSLETCSITHFSVTEKNICTSTEGRKGSCQGDSGGPLVLNGIQIGIVSFGIPCALGSPDVYTRVYSYQKWIAEHKE